jgi:thiamine biosynthesis lipoprotein
MKFDIRKFILLLTLVIGVYFLAFYGSGQQKEFKTETGRIHGTFYKIKYEYSPEDSLTNEFAEAFRAVEQSLSPYRNESVISHINRNDSTVVPDSLFMVVFNRGKEISYLTNGAFDMTVAPLVNAWGFGFKEKENMSSGLIDSLLAVTGFNKIYMEGDRIIKEDPRIMLDASGIAKGYSCDVIASLLDSKGVMNYLVDIGGELVAKGHNENGNKWAIGIMKPFTDSIPFSEKQEINMELQRAVYLDNQAMATSGDYLQFYVENGRKYSHIIDPRTGYPVNHSLLSVTIIASDCMTADAYATACMVLGMEESLVLINRQRDLHAYFIYTDSVGNMAEKYTDGFEKYFNRE